MSLPESSVRTQHQYNVSSHQSEERKESTTKEAISAPNNSRLDHKSNWRSSLWSPKPFIAPNHKTNALARNLHSPYDHVCKIRFEIGILTRMRTERQKRRTEILTEHLHCVVDPRNIFGMNGRALRRFAEALEQYRQQLRRVLAYVRLRMATEGENWF